MIRQATVGDVPRLGKIINDCAEYGLMLHRSPTFLYEHVRDFYVAVEKLDDRLTEIIVGVCGLRVIWANWAEVYALAVAPDQRGKGLGGQLVEAAVNQARNLGVPQLMTLTYEQKFFEKFGFEILDRQRLPLKIWSECIRCSKNQACDEIAMARILSDVPDSIGPNRTDAATTYPEIPPPTNGGYIVPTVLTVGRSNKRQKMDEVT